MKEQNQIEIYKATDGTTQIKVQFEQDTVWLTQQQMQVLFQKSKATISQHITNIGKCQNIVYTFVSEHRLQSNGIIISEHCLQKD